MDKRSKDKLVRSPRENGGGQDAQKDLHSKTGRDEKKGKTQERWKKKVERDLQVLGMRRWRELEADRKKWNDIVGQAKAHSGLQCQWRREKKKKKKKKFVSDILGFHDSNASNSNCSLVLCGAMLSAMWVSAGVN